MYSVLRSSGQNTLLLVSGGGRGSRGGGQSSDSLVATMKSERSSTFKKGAAGRK